MARRPCSTLALYVRNRNCRFKHRAAYAKLMAACLLGGRAVSCRRNVVAAMF